MQNAIDGTNGINFNRKRIRVQLSRAAQGQGSANREPRTRPQVGSGKCFNCGVQGHWYI